MSDWPSLSRRRFLSGLAILGAAPFTSLSAAVRSLQEQPQFTGDEIDRAHALFLRPGDRQPAAETIRHQGVRDAIVIGGGIAGLVAAYQLRKHNVLVLEGASEPGGVAKSGSWNGLSYALGAAYIIDPDPESDDERERRGFELLEALGLRSRDEDLRKDRTKDRRIGGEANHCVFSPARVLGAREVYSARTDAFFRHVLDSDRYPAVPPADDDLLDSLDRLSFAEFLKRPALQRRLYGRTPGPISRTGWEAIEYYFWGAFGATAAETSAYHGLNFFAAEYGDLLIFPGGNGYIARRLAERLALHDPDMVRTKAWAVDVETLPKGGYAVFSREDGRLHRYESRTVIFAAPLFLAPRIIRSMSHEQRRTIESLEYRAYVVANLLLGRGVERIFRHPAFRNGYELTPVHGIDVGAAPADRLARSHGFSDAVVADFAKGRNPKAAVLTVYRPYPYRSGRAEVMSASYGEVDAEIRRTVVDALGRHGLRSADIVESRISRWGHAMVVARPGQLVDGTLRRASAPLPGLWFAHTDVQGAPAYENALAASFDAADAARAYLSQ
jgi:predicted NAD/FAD-binding protein